MSPPIPTLPPFLYQSSKARAHEATGSCHINSFFAHERLGNSQALYWPSSNTAACPDLVLVFVTGLILSQLQSDFRKQFPLTFVFNVGNPGLADFYIPFLSVIYDGIRDRSNVTIYAHGLLGHVPGAEFGGGVSYKPEESLDVQVSGFLEFFEAIKSFHGAEARLVFMGHSVGSWIGLQALKERVADVAGFFLLCPTLSEMARTPNGIMMKPIFHPSTRRLLCFLAPLLGLLPLSVFQHIYSHWPKDQLDVLRKFVSSSSCVGAALSMGREELKHIREPDLEFMRRNKDKLWFYYVEPDGWVGDERHKILSAVNPGAESTQVVHGPSDVPHAFCINHSTLVAYTCVHWLDSILNPQP